MAIDFSKYIAPPKFSQDNFDFGQASRDLIEARLARGRLDEEKRYHDQTLGENQAGRQDENTRFSANLATNSADKRYELAAKKQVQLDAAVTKARQAVTSGDWNTADALMGHITELGGKVDKQMGANGRPVYSFQGATDPTLGTPDYKGTRSAIFGDDQQGQSPPGLFSDRNPFDSLPGASQQAMPSQGPPPQAPQDAGPPPGAAVDGAPPVPPQSLPAGPGKPGDAAATGIDQINAATSGLESALNGQAQSSPPAPGGQPPPGARNPFDPFRLDTNQLVQQNEARLQPYFDATKGAFPGQYQSRVASLNKGASSLGLNPEDTLKLWQPTLNTAAGLMKADIQAQSAGSRLAVSGQNMENTQNQKLREFAARRVNTVSQQYNTKESYKRYVQIAPIDKLLDEGANGNGQADVQAISSIRNLYQSGVMTDNDFKDTKEGVRDMWQKVKDATIETFLQNGINPDSRANLHAIVRLANAQARANLEGAQRAMLTRVVNNRTVSDEERQEYISAAAEMTPQELWSPEVYQWVGMEVPQKRGSMDQSGNYPVSPPQGGGSSASISTRSSSRGPKEKKVEDMTDEEVLEAVKKLPH